MSIKTMPMNEYLALPAVSASLVRAILPPGCPRAAWFQSWLNPNPVREESAVMDVGTLAHAVLLEGGHGGLVIVDAEDWRTKAAKEARDMARLEGKLPVLAHKVAEVDLMVASARAFIESCKETEPAIWRAFQPDGGRSEVTIQWDDAGLPCKIRPDRIATDNRIIVDLKFTATSPDPDSWGRTQLIRMGYYISAAFYKRVIKATSGVAAEYAFLVVSTDPPYLPALVGIDPQNAEMGARRVASGLKAWQHCLQNDRWPAYPNRIVYPTFPAYEAARIEEEEGYAWSEELYK